MSEKQPSPVTREPASGPLIHTGTISQDHASVGKGIRLSTVRAGLSWETMDLPQGHYTLGSRSDSDIVIDAPGVAERHCAIIVGAQRTVIKAFTNRTWINDGAVTEGTLRAGDRLILGPIELRVSVFSPSSPPSRINRSAGWHSPSEPVVPLVSEEEFQELLGARSISEQASPATVVPETKRGHQDEALLQELRQEIDNTLQDVLCKEHAHREEFDRQRLQLSHRAQELSAQWEEMERIRAKLLKEEAALTSAADAAGRIEQQRLAILNQEELLADRHEELARRSQSLVATHRRLKVQKQALERKRTEQEQQAASSEQVASIRSLLARNEAQSRQLAQRHKELDQREESVLQQSAELAASRSQLQEQSRQLENERRQWQVKCKNRERFLDDFELSLTSRTEEIAEEELRQKASHHQLEQRTQELDRRLQEIQLQQQGVDQATRLLEQQQAQFAQDDVELAERKRQLEQGLAAIESEKRELQAARELLAQERAELDRRADELQRQQDELNLQAQSRQDEQQDFSAQRTELDTLRQELDAAREQLQIDQSELSADQQNLQRLRGELDAERQRDVYERQQLQQARSLLEQQQQELVSAREELERQGAELTFQQSQQLLPALSESHSSVDMEELQQARREMERTREEFEAAQAQLQSDRNNLLEERGSLERRQNQIESAREQLSLEQQQLQSLRSDIEQSRRELTSDQNELAESRRRLHADKEELDAQWDALRQQRDALPAQADPSELADSPGADRISPLEHSTNEEQTEETTGHTVSDSHDSEGDAALQLRQQLASLFGMKADAKEETPAASRPTESSLVQETPEPEIRFPSSIKLDDHAVTDRSKNLNDAASRSHSSSESGTGASSRQSSDSTSSEDDSIAAYMERLLARTRKSSPQNEPAVQQPVSPPPRPEASFRPVEQPVAEEEETSPTVVKKVRKMDEEQKKSIRNNLHSFREVANQSARTAVAKSHRIRKSNSLRYMVALNVIGWVLTFGLFIAERWLSFSLGYDALSLGGISFCLTLLCLYRYKEIRKLSMGNQSAESDKPVTRTGTLGQEAGETPEDKSSPLSFL